MPEMKVEIDLNEILGDEYGNETLQESVRRQVVEKLTNTIKQGVDKQINAEVSRIITREIEKAVKEQMPTIVDDLLNAEYVCVDRWGDGTGKKTTFRKELVKSVQENMVYKKTTYDNDRTAFTKAVDSVISESVNSFKEEFKKLVDAAFARETLALAVDTIKKKLGIS